MSELTLKPTEKKRPRWMSGNSGNVYASAYVEQAGIHVYIADEELKVTHKIIIPRAALDAAIEARDKAKHMPKRDDLCVCGHPRHAHIYDTGACRPGFECENACESFRKAKR